MNNPNNSPKATPFWWEDAGEPRVPAELRLPREIDVVVIGGGLTGLSAALTLARHGKPVLVLESSAPGFGASARNGGMIGGGHRLAVEKLDAILGRDLADRLLRESHQDSMTFVQSLMDEEGISCDFSETGRLRSFWGAGEYDITARELEVLRKRISLEAWMVRRSEQFREVASELYSGGIVYARHGGLNPAKWVAGICRAAVRAGAIVRGNTPVDAVERDGEAFLVTSRQGTVRAGSVLVATNGYTPGFLTDLKRRIVPVPSFIITTERLGSDQVKKLFPNRRMIVESRSRYCYFRPSPDLQRIVFGGRAAMFDIPESMALRQMKGLLAQVFPELEGVAITHSWRGYTGFTFNFTPHVGKLNGIWHAMGYSGSGNALAPYLGNKAALKILGQHEGETAFSQTPFPAPWWHRGQPWFLPIVDLQYRCADAFGRIGRKR